MVLMCPNPSLSVLTGLSLTLTQNDQSKSFHHKDIFLRNILCICQLSGQGRSLVLIDNKPIDVGIEKAGRLAGLKRRKLDNHDLAGCLGKSACLHQSVLRSRPSQAEHDPTFTVLDRLASICVRKYLYCLLLWSAKKAASSVTCASSFTLLAPWWATVYLPLA